MKKINWRHPFQPEYQKPELCRPHRDWRVMLSLTAVLLVITFLAYFWFNQTINHLSDQPAIQPAPNISANFSAAQIAQYVNDLETRRVQFEQHLKQPPIIADPSL